MTVLTDFAAPTTASGEVVPSSPTVVVPVHGPLDCSSVARVREVLDQAVSRRPPQLVVDLTDCPFVDAAALALLLETHRRLARRGSVLTLQGCSPRVLRLLSLTGLRRVFDLA